MNLLRSFMSMPGMIADRRLMTVNGDSAAIDIRNELKYSLLMIKGHAESKNLIENFFKVLLIFSQSDWKFLEIIIELYQKQRIQNFDAGNFFYVI